ncbi:MAG: diguanylate cyclase [Candidatus Izemoplasma sp.]
MDKKTELIDNHLNEMYCSIIDEIPLPLFCVNLEGEVKYKNQIYSDKFVTLHKIIEEMILHKEMKNYKSETVHSVVLFKKDKDYHVFNIAYDDFDISITRKQVVIQDEKCIIYIHQKKQQNHIEEIRLKKILKANELILEIKDIIDNVSDLNQMFDYFLSKIHNIISEVCRSCILKIDEKDNLFLDSKFNFSDHYAEKFSLPFKGSFAYMHMANDYTRSVIINDIQKKYSDLFPIQTEEGIAIESNISTPLVVNGKFYGIVSVDSDKNRVFDDVDLYLLDFIKGQIERVIEKHNKYQTIKKESILDPMTGVSNRRSLENLFSDLVNKSRVENSTFLFVVFDLNKLKTVNDNYGHIAGDKVIKQFSFVINKQIRDYDSFARFGGDEFVGIFVNVEEKILIERIESWRTYFSTHFLEFKGKNNVTEFSYGISKYPEEGTTFDELMDLADKRMYIQKRKQV